MARTELRTTVPATPWTAAIARGLVSGAVGSVLSGAALALLGKIEQRNGAWPLNGPSQWIWGRSAAHRRALTVRHTLLGYAIHHAMATGWAVLHERLLSGRARGEPLRELACGATTAAVACFVDYRLTPKRLEPGFNVPLSRFALLGVYAAFGAGLAASGCWPSRSARRL
jgi:hypothetical protein